MGSNRWLRTATPDCAKAHFAHSADVDNIRGKAADCLKKDESFYTPKN